MEQIYWSLEIEYSLIIITKANKMKLLFIFTLILLFCYEANAQGVTKYGESLNVTTNFVDKNSKISSSGVLNKNGKILSLSVLTAGLFNSKIFLLLKNQGMFITL